MSWQQVDWNDTSPNELTIDRMRERVSALIMSIDTSEVPAEDESQFGTGLLEKRYLYFQSRIEFAKAAEVNVLGLVLLENGCIRDKDVPEDVKSKLLGAIARVRDAEDILT